MSVKNRIVFGVLSLSTVACIIVALVAAELGLPALIVVAMSIMSVNLVVAIEGTSVMWKASVLAVLALMFFGLYVPGLPRSELIIWSTVATFAVLRFWERSSDNVNDHGVSGATIVSIVLMAISLPFSGYPKRYLWLQIAGDYGLLLAILIPIESIVICAMAVLCERCVASVFPGEIREANMIAHRSETTSR